MSEESEVIIDYTNYRGERGERRIVPIDIKFKSTEWHPKRQWILRAWDVEKAAIREFAILEIHSWHL